MWSQLAMGKWKAGSFATGNDIRRTASGVIYSSRIKEMILSKSSCWLNFQSLISKFHAVNKGSYLE
jgi:hypothetical protein